MKNKGCGLSFALFVLVLIVALALIDNVDYGQTPPYPESNRDGDYYVIIHTRVSGACVQFYTPCRCILQWEEQIVDRGTPSTYIHLKQLWSF